MDGNQLNQCTEDIPDIISKCSQKTTNESIGPDPFAFFFLNQAICQDIRWNRLLRSLIFALDGPEGPCHSAGGLIAFIRAFLESFINDGIRNFRQVFSET